MRVLFLSDTHLGFDLPTRPRLARRRRGGDFFHNFERALEPARMGEVNAVVRGGDLFYRSRVPAWLAEAAFARRVCLRWQCCARGRLMQLDVGVAREF